MDLITVLIMVSRSPLLQVMVPLCWEELWSVSRAGAELWTTPPSMEVTSATENQSRRDSVSQLSVSDLRDPQGLREGMDYLVEMETQALLVFLDSEERLDNQERMVAPVFLEEMGRTEYLDPKVRQERMVSMVRWVLLVPLGCQGHRDRPGLRGPGGDLETRGRTDLWARQERRGHQARMAAMDPLDPRDLPD